MDTGSSEYKKAFDQYIRKGIPIDLSLKKTRATTHYIWRTQNDRKVRSSHAANDGKIFSWDKPPKTGHPGEDYGCRCWAQAHEPKNPNRQADGNTPSITSSLSELVPPTKGLFGTEWAFKAGREVRLEVQSTNVIGTVGFWANYRVYSLDEYGRVIPQFRNPGSEPKIFESHILPMLTRRKKFSADFSSPYG